MDTPEYPEQRHRQPGRRDSDTVAFARSAAFEVVDEDVREIAVAIKKVQTGWKRWLAFAGVVGMVISAILGTLVWLGFTFLSPGQRFEEHDKAMRIEVSSLRQRTTDVEEAVDLMSYLLCVQIRRTDPNAVPPKCNDASIRRLAPK